MLSSQLTHQAHTQPCPAQQEAAPQLMETDKLSEMMAEVSREGARRVEVEAAQDN